MELGVVDLYHAIIVLSWSFLEVVDMHRNPVAAWFVDLFPTGWFISFGMISKMILELTAEVLAAKGGKEQLF